MGEFPGGKGYVWCFHCHGLGLIPGQRPGIPQKSCSGAKKIEFMANLLQANLLAPFSQQHYLR